MAYGACAAFEAKRSLLLRCLREPHNSTAQLAKMMSVRELQILGEEREEKDRMQCRESLLAFGLGKNVITVQLHSYGTTSLPKTRRRARRRATREISSDSARSGSGDSAMRWARGTPG